MRQALKTILDAVLPPRCPISGAVVPESGLVAPEIWSQLEFFERPFCACCGVRFDVPADPDDVCPACLEEPPPFDQARTALTYNDFSRAIILGFKHGDQTHLTATFLPWMVRAASEFQGSVDLVMPVPLHRWRLLRRRYNQAALLSGALGRAFGVTHDPLSLIRVKPTPSQGHMTRTQRIDNVAGAFTVRDPSVVAGKRILLVDDVYTTGATVRACARTLKSAGAAAVYVVTLARVLRATNLG